jgi:hypothetical protein
VYEIPGPGELKKFMVENNLTGADVAALTGVTPRAARRWVQSAESKGARPIPWAVWAIMQIFTGKKKPKDYLTLIDGWKREGIGRGLYERGTAGRPPKEGKDD